jgi:hypothetical protein
MVQEEIAEKRSTSLQPRSKKKVRVRETEMDGWIDRLMDRKKESKLAR